MKFAGLFLEIAQDAAQRLALHRDQLGHQQAGQHAVLLRDVASDAQAAGLLAADDDRLALHQRADVLEADRRLVNLHPEQFRHGIDLVTRRHGADDRAPDATIFAEVIQCQREHLVGREPGAVAIDDAEAVGVAVQPQPEPGLASANQRRGFAHPLRAWLGRAAAKERVEGVAEANDVGAGLLKQRVEIAPAGAVHQLHRDLQLGPADRPQVDELADAFQVGRSRVECLALERAHHGGLGLPPLGEQLLDVGLDFVGHVAGRARAIGHGILETRVAERIVAGGDVDAADGFAPLNAEGENRGGGVAVAEQRLEAVLGQDLRGGQGEFAP